jgi:hypothetical protein
VLTLLPEAECCNWGQTISTCFSTRRSHSARPAVPVSTVLPAAMEPWPVHRKYYLVPDLLFSTLSTAPAVSNSEWSAMKSQLTFIPEALTCCTLYNHCDYYDMTLLVIYERLNILTMYWYNLHPTQPEEDWPPLRAWFLSRFLPRFLPF